MNIGRRESGRSSFVRESFVSNGQEDGTTEQPAFLSEQEVAEIVNCPVRLSAEETRMVNNGELRQSFGPDREKSVEFRSGYSSYTNFGD